MGFHLGYWNLVCKNQKLWIQVQSEKQNENGDQCRTISLYSTLFFLACSHIYFATGGNKQPGLASIERAVTSILPGAFFIRITLLWTSVAKGNCTKHHFSSLCFCSPFSNRQKHIHSLCTIEQPRGIVLQLCIIFLYKGVFHMLLID